MSRQVVFGSDTNVCTDLPQLLREVQDDGFDFVSVPLVHPRHRRSTAGATPQSRKRSQAFTRSDLLLPSSVWTASIVGKVSSWIWPGIESPGSPNEELCRVRRNAEEVLKQELAWASHLSLPAVLFPSLPHQAVNTARLINQCVQQQPYFQVWITVPLTSWDEEDQGTDPVASTSGASAGLMPPAPPSGGGGAADEGEPMDVPGASGGAAGTPETAVRQQTPWQRWNMLRQFCECSQALFVCLDVCADLPEEEELARWEGEPVKVLMFHTSIFVTNKKGFPTLTRRHQAVFKRFSKFQVQVMVTGRPRHAHGRIVYLQYLQHLAGQIPPRTQEEHYESPYLDFLQAPLQPLMDNLESQTYETFEKDPIKYNQYRKATALALLDQIRQRHPGAPIPQVPASTFDHDAEGNAPLVQQAPGAGSGSGEAAGEAVLCKLLLMVVGAGRGPLVRASLKAAEEVSALLKISGAGVALDMRVYAVEKNPNAVVTLENMVAMEQWDNVEIIASDMRTWNAPEKADIMVSELLGSFGDNELSPECLDGAQEYLKPGTGVSIPCDYTSYVAPLSAAKLWNEVRNNKFTDLKGMETPYVVKLHNVTQLTTPQLCFFFNHPNAAAPDKIDNTRYQDLTFHLPSDATVHGLGGYFESRLYGDVYISILPGSPNFSHGMFSWFPLYIPLRNPIYVSADEPISVRMWRAVRPGSRVWYEWQVSTPHNTTPVHNPNGRSYWIGL